MNGVLKMKLKLWTAMLAVGLLAGCQNEVADVTNESTSLKSEEVSKESRESIVLTPEEKRAGNDRRFTRCFDKRLEFDFGQ